VIWKNIRSRNVTSGRLVDTTAYDNQRADVGTVTDAGGEARPGMFATDVVDLLERDNKQRFDYVQTFEYEVDDETYLVSHYTKYAWRLRDRTVVYYNPEDPQDARTLFQLRLPFYFYAGVLAALLGTYAAQRLP
jgi:hypothetical protein